MKYKLKSFIKSEDIKITFNYADNKNVLFEWKHIRNPLRTFFNMLIVKLSSSLDLKTKIFLFRYLLNVSIGKNVGVSPGVKLDYFYPNLISMEDNVIIGWQVNILCHEFTHNYVRIGRVILRDNCTIGAFSTIRSGVVVGKNSVVAMCSFVNKDIPPGEVWGGVPAKFISKVEQSS
ncbi:MAG: acyltransferase [Candidatus Woesearchaeota archaeon]